MSSPDPARGDLVTLDSAVCANVRFELFFAVVFDLASGEAVFQVEGLDMDAICALGATARGWLLVAATEPAYVIRFFDAATGAARPLT